MNRNLFLLCCLLLLTMMISNSRAYTQLPYVQTRNVVYAESMRSSW